MILELLKEISIVGISSFFMTIIFASLTKKIFTKIKLLDNPKKYNLKRKAIPYACGIAIFLSFFFSFLFFFDLTQKHINIIIIAFSIIFLVGFIDDIKNISPIFRIIFQFAIAIFLIKNDIKITHIKNPFGETINMDTYEIIKNIYLSDILTCFWIVFCINAMNFADGIPGLLSGLSSIYGFIFLGLFFMRPELFLDPTQIDFAKLSSILTFTALAFLFFDFYPPKILMGDSGSTLLGFMIAIISIFSGAKLATAILVLGIILGDAIFVIVMRIKSKKSPFKGDFTHLHHKMMQSGISKRKILIIYYLLAILFGLIAMFLPSIYKIISIFILFLVFIFLAIHYSKD